MIQTYQTSISAGGAGTSLAEIGHRTAMAARRIAPPRDATWMVQRIRLGASGGVYLYQSEGNGFGNATNQGVMPMAGVWRNRIAQETEVVFVGCVPPTMTAYDPQSPVPLRWNDFLIFGVMDVCICAAGTTVPAGLAYTVNIEIDYEELLDKGF